MKRPVVLVFDPITSIPWSYGTEERLLGERGVDLVVPGRPQATASELATCDVVISSGRVAVTAEVIGNLKACVGILCYSAGRDAVDEQAARAAGVPVVSVHAATPDVADHTIALLLAAVRRIVPLAQAAAAGDWAYAHHQEIWKIPRLAGKVLGVIGAGRVGRAIAHRARAFGMHTIATYRNPAASADPQLPHESLSALIARSDAIVLAAALTDDTRGIIDAEALRHVKHGVVIVNVGRGALIDEDALADALDSGIVGAAALDVRGEEPPNPSTDRLGGRPNVLQTPHVAGASAQARIDIHVHAADGVIGLLEASGRLHRP